MSVDKSFPVFEPPSWIFGYTCTFGKYAILYIAQPYSGKVTKAHSSIFHGSRDTGANVTWGNFAPGGYIRVNETRSSYILAVDLDISSKFGVKFVSM